MIIMNSCIEKMIVNIDNESCTFTWNNNSYLLTFDVLLTYMSIQKICDLISNQEYSVFPDDDNDNIIIQFPYDFGKLCYDHHIYVKCNKVK